MKISSALAAQAKAQLDLIRYKLNNSEVLAPFKGIKNKIGSPGIQGQHHSIVTVDIHVYAFELREAMRRI